MKKYFQEIDIMKGIAIIMVVFSHSIIVYPVDLHEINWCKWLFDIVTVSHMPIFFMVSGLCWSYGKGGYGAYIMKKFRRIALPYIVVNLIDMGPRMIAPMLVNHKRDIMESVVKFAIRGGSHWFLYALFMVFMVFPLIAKMMEKPAGKIGVIVVCLALKFIPEVPTIFVLHRIVFHLLYFVVGYALKPYVDIGKLTEKVKANKAAAVSVVAVAAVASVLLLPLFQEEEWQGFGIPLACLGIVAVCVLSSLLTGTKAGTAFADVGQYSLQLYLFNGFMLTISRAIIVSLLHVQAPLLIIGFNFLVDFFVSYFIIKYILTRFRVTRIATGMV